MRARGLLAICAVIAACDSGSSATHTAAGGTPAAGGTTASGGATASGGGGSGGATSVGGSTGTGGVSASGGTTATGGGAPSGGATANGGSVSSGGGPGTGGRTGTGGTTAPRSDAGSDSGRTDAGAGGSGGTGGTAGGAGGTGGGAGGTRPDAGSDARLDARTDASADVPPEARADLVVSDGRATSDGAPCPHAGSVTYTLTENANASAEERSAYPLMRAAMDKALYYYNCYTDITRKLTVTYNASVQTVDGNINGSIRFGPNTSYMEYTRAMHEISHTVGVGTASSWQSLLVTPAGGGTRVWSGSSATGQLRAITGAAGDVLYGDNQHFWPYGLNYASEVKSEADVINHCLIVVALRQDMGNP